MNETVELLRQLVGIPSINPMGRDLTGDAYLETRLTAFLESWLQQYDLEVRRQPVSPGRDNLLATYHNPNAKRHVLLEVHQDTVPVDDMEIEPFAGKVEGNRLYGRGACDNKGPMTAMLLALRRLAIERPAGSASVTLALTVDEEFTFTGVQELVREKPKFDFAIVAEPTDLDIVVAHKGVVRFEVVTLGVSCHSSAPDNGINAIYRMTPVLAALERYAHRLSDRTIDLLLGGPTLSVGRIEGGMSVNIVPSHCRIEVDRRLIPGESPATAHRDVAMYIQHDKGVIAAGGAEVREPWMSHSPLVSTHNKELAERLGRSIAKHRQSHAVVGVPYGTDASTIALAGIPAVVFGPGSIDLAHTKAEWVPLDQVAMATEIYHDFCLAAEQDG